MAKNTEIVEISADLAYLKGGSGVIVYNTDTGFLEDGNFTGTSVKPKKGSAISREVDFVPMGQDDKLPAEIMLKIAENTTVASNIEFKANMAYGDGLLVYRKITDPDTGKTEIVEVQEDDPSAHEIFELIANSNYKRVMLEIANDMVVFSDSFAQLVFGRAAKGGKRKIVQIWHREACFSRLSVQDKETGRIDYHGYSSEWGVEASPENVIVRRFLDRKSPLYDLKVRMGLVPDPETGETSDEGEDNGYVMSLGLPVPGRYYYNRPYWWSIFVDWYDFSCAIPKFKKALLKHQMVLRYQVSVNKNFYSKLFKSENITDPVKQADRKTQFLTELNDFLSGSENAGKSFVETYEYDKLNKYEEHDIIIKPLESFIKGGEYIEDSEEVTNVICNTMAVHPSLKGASPGKNKNINGTEARELFIIAQVLFKPIREMMLMPLYIAKEINGWPKDIHFAVPNIMLTTLDKNTGSEKSIGNEKI